MSKEQKELAIPELPNREHKNVGNHIFGVAGSFGEIQGVFKTGAYEVLITVPGRNSHHKPGEVVVWSQDMVNTNE